MSFLNSLIGNKTVLKLALSTIKSAMDKEGISAILILPSEATEGDTPGLDIRSFKEPIGVLSGGELDNYIAYCAEEPADSTVISDAGVSPKKEVSNGI